MPKLFALTVIFVVGLSCTSAGFYSGRAALAAPYHYVAYASPYANYGVAPVAKYRVRPFSVHDAAQYLQRAAAPWATYAAATAAATAYAPPTSYAALPSVYATPFAAAPAYDYGAPWPGAATPFTYC